MLALLALAALSPLMRAPDAGAPVAEAPETVEAPAAPLAVEEAPAAPADKGKADQPDEAVPATPAQEPKQEGERAPAAAPEAAPEPAPEAAPTPAPEPAPVVVPLVEPAAQPAPASAPETGSTVAIAPDAAPRAPQAVTLPETQKEGETTPKADLPPPAPTGEAKVEAAPTLEAPLEGSVAPEPAVETTAEPEEPAPEVEADEPDQPVVAPEETPLPAPEAPENGQAAPAATLAPAPPLADQAPGVTTDRLPRIGDAPAEAPPEAPPEATETEPEAADLPPILAGARAFDADPALPRLAVILLDIGAAGLPRADLARLPFAVTFAIDPLAPDAAQAATEYRAAGQEVVLLAPPLPEGATPADLETAIEAAALTLPQAVAMLERPTVEGAERRLAAQSVPILKAQGRGLVTLDGGLASAEQAALRDGLPHAEVYRLLDAQGEAAPVILRYLDRAAFKAKQEGQVLVLGQTRPETVAALVQWMTEGQGNTLAIAPLTALLGAP